MRRLLDALMLRWGTLQPREQRVLLAGGGVLGGILAALLIAGLHQENARLFAALQLTGSRYAEMQRTLDEAQSLRTRGGKAAPAGVALGDALASSLRARRLALAVTPLPAGQFRVHGEAGFDESLAWLAAIQHDLGLRVLSLTAARNASGVAVDAVVGGAAQ